MPKRKVKAKVKVRATGEKPVCEKCGVDVRENTLFCYNCGSRVAGEEAPNANGTDTKVTAETRAALDDLAARFKIDEANEEDKLAHAADERRRARVSHRQPKQFTWEPRDDTSSPWILIMAIVIAVITFGVVLLTVFWP